MDQAERRQYQDDVRTREFQKLEVTLARHDERLVQLVSHHPIDIDILTDIVPEILDGSSQEGEKALDLWESLYAAIDSGNRFTAIVRYDTKPNPLVAHVTTPSRSQTRVFRSLYVRVFERLHPNQVLFERDGDVPLVAIKAPHSFFSMSTEQDFVEENAEVGIVATDLGGERFSPTSRRPEVTPELSLDPMVLSFDDPHHLYDRISEISFRESIYYSPIELLRWGTERLRRDQELAEQ